MPVLSSCSSAISASADMTLMCKIEPHADATDPKHIIIITNSHEPRSGAKPNRAILAEADQKIVRPRTVATITIGLSNL